MGKKINKRFIKLLKIVIQTDTVYLYITVIFIYEPGLQDVK